MMYTPAYSASVPTWKYQMVTTPIPLSTDVTPTYSAAVPIVARSTSSTTAKRNPIAFARDSNAKSGMCADGMVGHVCFTDGQRNGYEQGTRGFILPLTE